MRKDGTFDFNELFHGQPLTCSGTWCFTKGKGEEKNKESVVFTITAISAGKTFGGLFNQRETQFKYSITRLAKDEIKIRSEGNLALAEGDQSIQSIVGFSFTSQ